MNQFTSTPPEKDPKLWAIAKRRVGFKRDLLAYIFVNIFLWVIWLLTSMDEQDSGIPWPVWPMLGWGIGLLFEYAAVYKFPKGRAEEKEYEKLTRNQ